MKTKQIPKKILAKQKDEVYRTKTPHQIGF
jgi:hypothetical protein